jgi:GNAT superfamily N-acetyltransferase
MTDFPLNKTTPTPSDLQFLEDRLYEFNSRQVGRADGQLFGFIIRNEQQEIQAGIAGWTWAQACCIQQLWVHDSLRGQGLGRQLLEAAEQEARSRGCRVIMIETYSFQAPGFYQKCGYELAWQCEDFPPGHRQCVLVKRFP